MKQWLDKDGDTNLSIDVGQYTVIATEQASGFWTLNFGLTADVGRSEWLERLTGVGAFTTIRIIRPAVQSLLNEIALRGGDWRVLCDSRRAKLYSRYMPAEKILVTD